MPKTFEFFWLLFAKIFYCIFKIYFYYFDVWFVNYLFKFRIKSRVTILSYIIFNAFDIMLKTFARDEIIQNVHAKKDTTEISWNLDLTKLPETFSEVSIVFCAVTCFG